MAEKLADVVAKRRRKAPRERSASLPPASSRAVELSPGDADARTLVNELALARSHSSR